MKKAARGSETVVGSGLGINVTTTRKMIGNKHKITSITGPHAPPPVASAKVHWQSMQASRPTQLVAQKLLSSSPAPRQTTDRDSLLLLALMTSMVRVEPEPAQQERAGVGTRYFLSG
jgi:hypothetical protein